VHNLIHKYLDGIDSLKDGVDKNSELILKRIDLDRMLENPRIYLKSPEPFMRLIVRNY